MSRPLRVEYPGALYHVMSRGNERQRIVRDDKDREKRLYWLDRTVQTCEWRLHAFVIMGNHDHLFVETPRANLSAGMQLLNGSYTSYFNRRHGRVGHLFQGRFKAHLIEQEEHYLEVSRYIHLNPVRAGLVQKPEQCRWSSCRGYYDDRHVVQWVTYERVLREFGADEATSRRRYRSFVQAGIEAPPASPFREALHGLIIGSDAFSSRVKNYLSAVPEDPSRPVLERLRNRPSLAQIVGRVAQMYGVDPKQVWHSGRRSTDASRAVAAYLSKKVYRYRPVEVAPVLGYQSPAAVTAAVQRVERDYSELASQIDQIQRSLDCLILDLR